LKRCLGADQLPIVERAVLTALSLMPDVVLVEEVGPVIMGWIGNGLVSSISMSAFEGWAVYAPIEVAREGVARICHCLAGTDDQDAVGCGFDGLSALVKKLPDGVIWQTVASFANAFMDGKLAVTAGEQPLEADLELGVISSFAALISELIVRPSDANRSFFGFAVEMSTSDDQALIDASLVVFAEGVSAESFIEPEMAFVWQFVSEIVSPETPPTLIHSCSYLLAVLIGKGVDFASIGERVWGVLCSWFHRLAEQRWMGTALANVVSAMWALAVRYERFDADLCASMVAFPPADADETVTMCGLLLQMRAGRRGDLKYGVLAAVTRLLCLSRVMLARKKVSDEVIAALSALLNELCAGDPKAQEVVAAAAGQAENRRRRIQAFLQP